MKPELSELRKWLQTLLKKQNRARLALVLGCIAMALILLSELFPAKADLKHIFSLMISKACFIFLICGKFHGKCLKFILFQ